MKIRRFTSLTASFAFIVMTFMSVMMFLKECCGSLHGIIRIDCDNRSAHPGFNYHIFSSLLKSLSSNYSDLPY